MKKGTIFFSILFIIVGIYYNFSSKRIFNSLSLLLFFLAVNISLHDILAKKEYRINKFLPSTVIIIFYSVSIIILLALMIFPIWYEYYWLSQTSKIVFTIFTFVFWIFMYIWLMKGEIKKYQKKHINTK